MRSLPALLVLASLVPAQLSFPTFSSTTGLVLNGSAAQMGNVLRLTPAANGQAATVWHQTQQPVIGGFITSFAFQIGGPGGADGMTFIVHDDPAGTSALAQSGGSMGWTSEPLVATNTMQNLLVFEIDTYQNGNFGDPNDNHISVHLVPTIPTTANGADEFYSIGRVIPAVDLNDGLVHVMCINYVPGTLTVFLDDMTTPILTIPFDFLTGATSLAGVQLAGLNLPTGNAYVGFSAGTGGLNQTHDALAWDFGTGGCGIGGAWQLNSAESSLDVDGVQLANGFAGPANTNLINGANGTASISSTLAGAPFEIVLNVGPAIPASTFPGFFTLLGGQAVNVDVFTAVFLNGGPTFGFLPHPGAFSTSISVPNGVVVCGQQVVGDPGAMDGFTLSQAAQATGLVQNCPNSPSATNTNAGDDTTYNHTFGNGPFIFYGVSYPNCFVNSNGNITFVTGDTNFTESTPAFVANQPRIAPCWNDFSPNAGGRVNVEEIGGLFVATWFSVPEFGQPTTVNSFCATLDMATGTIVVAHDAMSLTGNANGLVGISAGGNLAVANNVDLTVGPNVAPSALHPIHEDFNTLAFGPFDLATTTHTYTPTGIGTGPYIQL